jgi:hypothetical protein
VKKGDLIWRFDSRIDRVFADWEVEHLPDLLRRFLEVYSTYHEEFALILCGDHGRTSTIRTSRTRRRWGLAPATTLQRRTVRPEPSSPPITA